MYKHAKYYKQTFPNFLKKQSIFSWVSSSNLEQLENHLVKLGVKRHEAFIVIQSLNKNQIKKLKKYGVIPNKMKKVLKRAGH